GEAGARGGEQGTRTTSCLVHEGPRVVPAEDRVFAIAPGHQGIQPASSFVQPGTKIEELVDPSSAYLIRSDWCHRLTECVSIGETGYADPATWPQPDLPPRSGVDLDQFVEPVPLVELVLGVEETPVADILEQAP